MKIPLNRFITFFKPYINLIAAGISAWIIAKLNVLSIPGLGENGDQLTAGIAAGLTFLVTTIITQLGDNKWLKGHHIQIAGDAAVQTRLLTNTMSVMPEVVSVDPVHEVLMDTGEDLPTDEEEFGVVDDDGDLEPPPTSPPVQPSQTGLTPPTPSA